MSDKKNFHHRGLSRSLYILRIVDTLYLNIVSKVDVNEPSLEKQNVQGGVYIMVKFKLSIFLQRDLKRDRDGYRMEYGGVLSSYIVRPD